MQVIHRGKLFLGFMLPRGPVCARSDAPFNWLTVLIEHLGVPVFPHTIESQTDDLIWATRRSHPNEAKGSVKAQGIPGSLREVTRGKGRSGNGEFRPDPKINISRSYCVNGSSNVRRSGECVCRSEIKPNLAGRLS